MIGSLSSFFGRIFAGTPVRTSFQVKNVVSWQKFLMPIAIQMIACVIYETTVILGHAAKLLYISHFVT